MEKFNFTDRELNQGQKLFIEQLGQLTIKPKAFTDIFKLSLLAGNDSYIPKQ